jgi:hypothetical protein
MHYRKTRLMLGMQDIILWTHQCNTCMLRKKIFNVILQALNRVVLALIENYIQAAKK